MDSWRKLPNGKHFSPFFTHSNGSKKREREKKQIQKKKQRKMCTNIFNTARKSISKE